MCQNAAPTVVATMTALRPMVVSLLTILGQGSTPDGLAAIAAFDAAENAVANWKQGTSAQTAIQLIKAFTSAFDAVIAAVPALPPEVVLLVNVISAGIVMVIGALTGNQPAPAGVTQKDHEVKALAETESKIKALVPGHKISDIDKGRAFLGDRTVAARELKGEWNKAVDAAAKVDPKYSVLKAA